MTTSNNRLQMDRAMVSRYTAALVALAMAASTSGCYDDPTGAPDGLPVPFITPVSSFYVYPPGEGTVPGWTMPSITAESWQMTIEEGPNPLTLKWSDLMAARDAGHSVKLLKTMQSIFDSPMRLEPTGLSGTAYWTGIPLQHFIESAGILADEYPRLIITGSDRLTDNLSTARVLSDSAPPVILAYEMNGQPIPREQGGPVRIVVQERYEHKNVAWVSRIRASTFDRLTGTMQSRGYAGEGVIRLNSRATNIHNGIELPAGIIELTGVALSGTSSIAKVEVKISSGETLNATLEPIDRIRSRESIPADLWQTKAGQAYPFVGVWTPWRVQWRAKPGSYEVAVQATDAAGVAQAERDTTLAYGQGAVARYRVTIK